MEADFYDRITERVLLGRIPLTEMQVRVLSIEGVTHVVSVCDEQDPAARFRGTHIRQVFIPINHANPHPGRIREAVLAVEEPLAASPDPIVFLHCWNGRSRSAVVMAGLIVRQERCTIGRAWECLASLRPAVSSHYDAADSIKALADAFIADPAFRRPDRSGQPRLLGELERPLPPLMRRESIGMPLGARGPCLPE